ncbi:hypothetical protein ACEPAG_9626 [Sanghuangporus baumii]
MNNPDKISVAAASDAARFAKSAIQYFLDLYLKSGTYRIALSSYDRSGQLVNQKVAHSAAAQDAARLASTGELTQPLHTAPSVNLSGITHTEARIITSEEHRALGYRPPQSSLAAIAQLAAARHAQEDPESASERGSQRTSMLKEAARMDAVRIATEKDEAFSTLPTVGLDEISKEEAARLQSAEHKILGYRPPPGSLASQAQSAADCNMANQNRINGEGPGGINLNSMTQSDASRLMSEEHRRLGRRPPADSLSAQAQSAVSARSD